MLLMTAINDTVTRMQAADVDRYTSTDATNNSSDSILTTTVMTSFSRTRDDRGLQSDDLSGSMETTTTTKLTIIENESVLLERVPLNIRTIVFGTSAAFLLLVLIIVIIFSRRRCRLAAGNDTPPLGSVNSQPSVIFPVRLLSYISASQTPSLSKRIKKQLNADMGPGPGAPSASDKIQQFPCRRKTLQSVDESIEFYATKYDSGSRSQTAVSATADGSVGESPRTIAMPSSTQPSVLPLDRRSSLTPLARQRTCYWQPHQQRRMSLTQTVSSVQPSISHNPLPSAAQRYPLRAKTIGNPTTTEVDIDGSAGAAIDSGISGMDVSTSTAVRDDFQREQIGSSRPMSVVVVSGSKTSTDESVISSLSVAPSDDENDKPLPPESTRPKTQSSLFVARGDTGSSTSAGFDDLTPETEVVLSPPARRRRRILLDNRCDLRQSKRPKFFDQRRAGIFVHGSPHPRRGAISCRFLPSSRSAVRRCNPARDVCIGDNRQARGQHQPKGQHCDSPSAVERIESGQNASRQRVGDGAYNRRLPAGYGVEEEDNSSRGVWGTGPCGNRLQVEIHREAAVLDVASDATCHSDNENLSSPCLSTGATRPIVYCPAIAVIAPKASSPPENSSQQQQQEQQQEPCSGLPATRLFSDRGRPHYIGDGQDGCTNPNTQQAVSSGDSDYILPTASKTGNKMASTRPRAATTDLERRCQLSRLLRRHDFNEINADVLEFSAGGKTHLSSDFSWIRKKQKRAAKWEIKTAF